MLADRVCNVTVPPSNSTVMGAVLAKSNVTLVCQLPEITPSVSA